jgi:hypothetical protein
MAAALKAPGFVSWGKTVRTFATYFGQEAEIGTGGGRDRNYRVSLPRSQTLVRIRVANLAVPTVPQARVYACPYLSIVRTAPSHDNLSWRAEGQVTVLAIWAPNMSVPVVSRQRPEWVPVALIQARSRLNGRVPADWLKSRAVDRLVFYARLALFVQQRSELAKSVTTYPCLSRPHS